MREKLFISEKSGYNEESGETMGEKQARQQRMPYTNREISWLAFNERVLDEAYKQENPVLERLKFLAITASNLDEFFMVRVAGLREQARQGIKVSAPHRQAPASQLKEISELAHAFMKRQSACYMHVILPALRKQGIDICRVDACTKEEKKSLAAYFYHTVYPVLTPLAVDMSRPFPLLGNRTVNIAVKLKDGDGPKFAVVQVPGILDRFIPVNQEKTAFVLLEDLIVSHIAQVFDGYRVKDVALIRITRNADLTIDEGADDLMEEVRNSIKKRKRGKPVRLEILAKCDADIRAFLLKMLDVKQQDVYEIQGPMDFSAFLKLAQLPGWDRLRLPPVQPAEPYDFLGCVDLFAAIRTRDRLVHHPYESFSCVIRFLETAACDPDVLAIKQTLYRVSGDSPVVHALERAAENGKQVTVLVELKARFDEENNIHWAKRLERAGCHVVYGLEGLKTHCKILLVVRREADGIRRYLHLGTGNYNDSTARLYTDMGLFTCREEYGEDASQLFNVLTGYLRPLNYQKFITAPDYMRAFFMERIQQEMENARRGLPSGIVMKMNSLVDPDMVRLLYAASNAGVPVRLIVRGICTLVPGVPAYSEHIEVRSIVGQLLEHSRIYRFENAGAPLLYLGSADLMPRNLDKRIELIFPVEDPRAVQRLELGLLLMLADTSNARRQLPDTSYEMLGVCVRQRVNCQRAFSEIAHQREQAYLQQVSGGVHHRPKPGPGADDPEC